MSELCITEEIGSKTKNMSQERFYSISQEMYQAFHLGEFEKAENLAIEYLDIAESMKSNWNYGNAVHHSNLILGRIAIKRGRINQAKDFLIQAGKTPGSPQLKSFGPNMMLAKELLELGEKEVVVEYIELTKGIWNWFFSWRKTKIWRKQIFKDRVPNFGANLKYEI